MKWMKNKDHSPDMFGTMENDNISGELPDESQDYDNSQYAQRFI